MKKIRLSRSVDRAWDFYGASRKVLHSDKLKKRIWKDIIAAGFTLVGKPLFKRFEGGGNGISFLAMVTESHISIHTSPENGRCLEITIHTCEVKGVKSTRKPSKKSARLIARLKKRFKPRKIVQFRLRVRANASKVKPKKIKHKSVKSVKLRSKKKK